MILFICIIGVECITGLGNEGFGTIVSNGLLMESCSKLRKESSKGSLKLFANGWGNLFMVGGIGDGVVFVEGRVTETLLLWVPGNVAVGSVGMEEIEFVTGVLGGGTICDTLGVIVGGFVTSTVGLGPGTLFFVVIDVVLIELLLLIVEIAVTDVLRVTAGVTVVVTDVDDIVVAFGAVELLFTVVGVLCGTVLFIVVIVGF